MSTTPKGLRLHIGFFGRRNVGKSSLLNAITRQHVSIVSDVAGTTTDPVEKPMELLPLGPVLFIDTAGIDEAGEALGALRVEKTRQALERTEIAVLVAEAGVWGEFEDGLLADFAERQTPAVVVFNKWTWPRRMRRWWSGCAQSKLRVVLASAVTGHGLPELREALLDFAPADFIDSPAIVGDLVGPGELAVLVVPIDKEAPKGRLILPQVQTIRDLLDTRRAVHGGEGARAAHGSGAAEDSAQAGGDGLAGISEGCSGHAGGVATDQLFDSDGALQGRSDGAGGGDAGHRAAAQWRPGADRGGMHASSHWRGHWTGEDPALADAVYRREAGV